MTVGGWEAYGPIFRPQRQPGFLDVQLTPAVAVPLPAVGVPLSRVEPPAPSEPPFALPFAGWLHLADIVGDVSAGIADIMRNAALLARAAMEEHTDQISQVIAEALDPSIFGRSAADVVTAELHEGLLPVSKDLCASLVAEAIEGLDDDESGLLGVGRAGEPRTAERRAPAAEEGGPARPRLVEGVVRLAARATGVAQPEWSDPTGLLTDPFTEIPQWWATAALELRELLGPGLSSVFCVTPVHRRGDRVLMQEITYAGREIKGLENDKVTPGAIVDVYGEDVDHDRANGFFETVDKELKNFSYVARITDEHSSRAARRLGKALQKSRPAISKAIEAAAAAAEVAGLAAAQAHGVPPELIEPLFSLLADMVTGLLEAVQQILERALADVVLTPWLLTHTVALPGLGSARVRPLSIWLLQSAGQQNWSLASAELDPFDPSRVVRLRDDYVHHVKFNSCGRVQVGASRRPSWPCPAALAGIVARERRPAVWAEPLAESAGFRVILPQAAPRGGMYLTAIRSELRYTLPETAREAGPLFFGSP